MRRKHIVQEHRDCHRLADWRASGSEGFSSLIRARNKVGSGDEYGECDATFVLAFERQGFAFGAEVRAEGAEGGTRGNGEVVARGLLEDDTSGLWCKSSMPLSA